VAYDSSCPSPGPLSVSDRRVLLCVSEAQAGPRATVSGSTEVSAASGMPARPYRDGRDLTFTDPAMPDGPAAMTVAEVPRRPLPTEGYDFDALAGDLGKLLTSTAHTSTWDGLRKFMA
jgi:hypothetical protein